MPEKSQTKIHDEKYVISINEGGLGNRLKCLISTLRIGKYLKRTPLLYWPENNSSIDTDFSDLFNLKINRISKEELDKTDKKNCEMYKDWLYNINTSNKYLILTTSRLVTLPREVPKKFAKVYPTERGNNIDFEFNRITEDIRKEIICYVKLLDVKKEILKKVESFSKKNNIKNCVGLHIRRKDFQDPEISPDGKGDISTDSEFLKRMNEIIKEDNKTRFFLCTDSEETEQYFKKVFKKKIVIFKKKSGRIKYNRDIKEALIDLLLLSRTKYILGTYLSTFTEIAWWFGECKTKVEIMGDYKIKEKKEVISKINESRNIIKQLKRRIGIIFQDMKDFV